MPLPLAAVVDWVDVFGISEEDCLRAATLSSDSRRPAVAALHAAGSAAAHALLHATEPMSVHAAVRIGLDQAQAADMPLRPVDAVVHVMIKFLNAMPEPMLPTHTYR